MPGSLDPMCYYRHKSMRYEYPHLPTQSAIYLPTYAHIPAPVFTRSMASIGLKMLVHNSANLRERRSHRSNETTVVL